MGLFGSSSPYDAEIEAATDETNTSENWPAILLVCDRVNVSTQSDAARECLKATLKRVKHANPIVALQALTLIDACVKNCAQFPLEIASRLFEDEVTALLSNERVHEKVQTRIKALIKQWAHGDFAKRADLRLIVDLYARLVREGYKFEGAAGDAESPKSADAPRKKTTEKKKSDQEELELSKAIELSLQEAQKAQPAKAKQVALYPTVDASSSSNNRKIDSDARQVKEPTRARALYSFEAVEDDELTFEAGELLLVLDDSDPSWWKGTSCTVQRDQGRR